MNIQHSTFNIQHYTPARPAWVEINLSNILKNVQVVRRTVGSNVKILAMVKANAYGHGAVEISRTLEKSSLPVKRRAGVNYLGVVSLEEALELRCAGIRLPILILGYTHPSFFLEVLRNNLTQTIYTLSDARTLAVSAKRLKKKARVHVKVDTGMGRLGVFPQEAVALVKKLFSLDHLLVEGIYTHFSSSDWDVIYTQKQLRIFLNVCDELEKHGFCPPVRHCANSGAVFSLKESHLNMVRPGLCLYGSRIGKHGSPVQFPVMGVKAKCISVKSFPAGEPVSYDRTFITRRPSEIAVVPVGYADGYPRSLSNKSKVLLKGETAPVVGKICMDFLMADVTDVKNVKTGDEVVLLGRQGKHSIAVEELASRAGTIPYEIFCSLGRRLPKKFVT